MNRTAHGFTRKSVPIAVGVGILGGFAFLGGLGAGAGVFDQPKTEIATPTKLAAPSSPAGVSGAVDALYDVISGDAGEPRDWDRMRGLFTEHATMGQAVRGGDGTIRFAHLTPESYIQLATPQFEQAAFYEREIARETRVFGEIAHVWSTYAAYRSIGEDGEPNTEPFMRGINSIQLVRQQDGSWKVRSIIWSPETPLSPLPG